MPTIYQSDDPSNSITIPALNILRKHIKDAYFAIREDKPVYESDTKTKKKKEKGNKVSFTKVPNATVGEEVYIIVETENAHGLEMLLNVRQGGKKGIVELDKTITVQQDGKDTGKIKATVGNLSSDSKITNKDDYKDWAVVRIILQPKKKATLKVWNDALKDLEGKKTRLYILVDADSNNNFFIAYHGTNPEDEGKPEHKKRPKRFLDAEGECFELKFRRKLNLNEKGFSNNSNVTIDHLPALEKGRPLMNKDILAIILHRTVSSNYPGNWMKSKTKIKGAHFYVDKDGTTYQTASLKISIAHIYASSSKQMYSEYYGKFKNSNTIGIEVVGNYIDNKWESLTNKQTEAVTLLVAQIKGEYNINNKDIYPHEKVQRKTPGEGKTVLDAIDLNF